MKVKDLIEKLKALPQDLPVMHVWDGEARTEIELVWLARSGDKVVTSDFGEVLYAPDSRPADAPGLEVQSWYSEEE